ncbi:glycosyltransferase [Formicincola oecophyllae]|uniref:Glycosyltransferase n=1 Tax=Formicincola oecophyllae TaxID=2558361 RepID=A0A4Y6U6N4_9PROT|nr:glycosyltransferase [Formicincola oecophyllae]QDH13023.1 glycosyltransferase [Formicincola oecophyllae]
MKGEAATRSLGALKIVHVSDFFFGLKSNAPCQFRVGGKISNGLVRLGHHVINVPYKDVARAGSFLGSRPLGRRALERALVDFVVDAAPDVLLLGHGYMVTPEALLAIKRRCPGLKMAQWNVDALYVPENAHNLRQRHQVVDATFTSTAPTCARAVLQAPFGGTVGWLPNPVDLSVERGRAWRDWQSHDPAQAHVFYGCGNASRPKRLIAGQWWNMDDFTRYLESKVRALLPNTVPVRFAYAGLRGKPYGTGAGYAAQLGRAAMGLNISGRPDWPLYSSDRLAHLAGHGQFVLVERQTGLERFFTAEEMGFFSTLDGLASLVAANVLDETGWRRRAQAGFERYSQLFNERRVAHALLARLYGLDGPASENDQAEMDWWDMPRS